MLRFVSYNMKDASTKKNIKRRVNNLILIVAIIVFLVSAAVIGYYAYDIAKGKKGEKELQKLKEPEFKTAEVNYGGFDFPNGIQEKYKRAYYTNSDFAGWLTVPGTNIDQPVVKGTDNRKYLHSDYYKNHNARGSIFMDYRNRLENDVFDTNTIIYGHNNLDSTMLTELEKYYKLDFYRQHPIIYFNTLFKDYKWKVVYVFATNAKPEDDNGYVFDYIYPVLSGENYREYLEELKKRSIYTTGVDINETDKLLTLSTCTRRMDLRRKYTDARFVVVARLLRQGEDETEDTAKAVLNSSVKYPQIWYDKNKRENPFKNDVRWYPQGAVE